MATVGVAVVDVVGRKDYLPDMVVTLAAAGHPVFLLLADCPVNMCVRGARNSAPWPLAATCRCSTSVAAMVLRRRRWPQR